MPPRGGTENGELGSAQHAPCSTVADLSNLLGQITGRAPFRVGPSATSVSCNGTPAHVIRLVQSADLSGLPSVISGAFQAEATAVESSGKLDAYRASYVIYPEPSGDLWIVGRTERGLENGVYAYLRGLGVNWLAPNDNWTTVMAQTYIRPTMPTVLLVRPRLGYFQIAADGGLHGGEAFPAAGNYDSCGTAEPIRAWNAWTRRLRMPLSSGAPVQGGQNTFVEENQAVLLNDPYNMAVNDPIALTREAANAF